MQNPVTGSGGMLLGEVAEVGPAHPAAGTLSPGTPHRHARLADADSPAPRVDRRRPRRDGARRRPGTAILFARTLFARLPDDFPEEVALAAFDVAGAPAGVLRDARPGETVLVIGTGKAGLLCLAAARESSRRVRASCSPWNRAAAAADRARSLGFADAVFTVDARDPVAMLDGGRDRRRTAVSPISSSTWRTPREPKSASVLCARDEGAVLFFGMATSFSAAALGAEGLAKPTKLPIGNGFVPGHDRAALDLLRRHPALARRVRGSLGPCGRSARVTRMAAASSRTSLRASGARRIAFLGLAKNAGKTTALTAVLAELHRSGVVAGATSAGRDGEEFDAITGEPKPRFRVYPGQLVASAATTFESASFPVEELATLPFPTRFGPVQLRRAGGEGEIEVIGPSTASQMARTAAALEAAGAELVLLDGAVGRRAFAAGRVCDGIVLSVGMSAGETLPAVLAAAAAARRAHPPPAPRGGRARRGRRRRRDRRPRCADCPSRRASRSSPKTSRRSFCRPRSAASSPSGACASPSAGPRA